MGVDDAIPVLTNPKTSNTRRTDADDADEDTWEEKKDDDDDEDDEARYTIQKIVDSRLDPDTLEPLYHVK